MQHVTVLIATKRWDCSKWVEVDNFWLKEKEEQKQQKTTTLTRVSGHGWKPLMPMLLSTCIKLWGSLTTFVKTKRKYRWSMSFRTVRVCVAWNCLESTSSFPEVEVAISLHFGCHTSTWLRFCWQSSEHPEKETGCYPNHDIWQIELCTLSPILLCPDVSAALFQPRCARWIHARRVFISAWFQPPLRKNPCRLNDWRNGEQGHTDARWT